MGIDEAGRGPLAGPVSVGVVRASARFLDLSFFKRVRDSKQLSDQKRRIIYKELKSARARGELSFAVALVSSKIIDQKGITFAIRLAIRRALNKLAAQPAETHVLLDGGLRAPRRFVYQETIVRGDEQEMLIALASIVAKVERDTKMERLSRKYPSYHLDEHKGYGTATHVRAIKKYGPSPQHRKTFLSRIIKSGARTRAYKSIA